MQVVRTIPALQDMLSPLRQAGKKIGLVPTMGALHAGHASLVARSVEENDVTVVSVFVNPTQFNDATDLERYPRTPEADEALLQQLGADLVFEPTVEAMYPEPDTRQFHYEGVMDVMEGPRRPGHFNGVCQVVSKLFAAVEPDRAYFGEKDFQQIAVIRAMAKELFPALEIVPCPIVREADGLALSSRNTLLSADERKLATNISRILFFSRAYARNHSLEETRNFVVDTLNSLEGFEVEYFEIVDGCSLQSLPDWEVTNDIVGCITVYCGAKRVRLIDNVRYK
ncbi:MAG: pantoate--beta-alanine ligase [Alloprevotella sp.]|nr:pantoate--beta-alanine ligase [Alloprevotella sp.]